MQKIEKFSRWFFDSSITVERIEEELGKIKGVLTETQEGRVIENLSKKITDVDGENVDYLQGVAKSHTLKKGYQNKAPENQLNIDDQEFIIFKDDDKIKLVILGSKTKSNLIIKKVFLEESFGKISEENAIEKDLLYWLVYRLRDYQGEPVGEEEEILLLGLHGYMGRSNDRANYVRGQGMRVIALMGTLSFIFNDEDLRALKPKIQYKDTVLTVEFNSNNTNRMMIEDDDDNIKMHLLVCKVILPKLVEAYHYAIEQGEWSLQLKLHFLKNIGNSINDKVEEQLNKIKKEIKRIGNNNSQLQIKDHLEEQGEFEFLEDDFEE